MLSPSAVTVLHRLNAAGFEAFAVGGCVRDLLRGIDADDIDITTNALPSQTMTVFSDCRVIPTGLAHGTVTVLLEDQTFEITTYRTDGHYSDLRHPDAVQFTSSLEDDLARRDFTINAMAFHPARGIIDPFRGQHDLAQRQLRCVGNAQTRFREDALRMARLIRFASVLDFDIEQKTAAAAHKLCNLLGVVAAERKRIEWMKALLGDGFLKVVSAFDDIVCEIIPSLKPLCGFEQHNPHHEFDVYTHTMRAVHAAPKDAKLRLALLFHDVGKPASFVTDEQGIGHFYGHPAVSEQIADQALKALRFDNATIRDVLPLIRHHDAQITPTRRCVRRWLSRLTPDGFRRLLEVKRADALACRENSVPPDMSEFEQLAQDILASEDCFKLQDLAVNGHDLMSLGCPKGPRVGRLLAALWEDVMEERLDNERTSLLRRAKEYLEHV